MDTGWLRPGVTRSTNRVVHDGVAGGVIPGRRGSVVAMVMAYIVRHPENEEDSMNPSSVAISLRWGTMWGTAWIAMTTTAVVDATDDGHSYYR